jgi:hypothetical protein
MNLQVKRKHIFFSKNVKYYNYAIMKTPMRKTVRKIGQIATGTGAIITLLIGRALSAAATTTPATNITHDNPAKAGAEAARGDGMPAELVGPDGIFTQITNTALYAVGIISIIMLIWGGLRYVVSGGDSKKVTDAKNTVIYAIIGLIIAILAYAIVNFVINALDPTQPES